MPIHGAYIFERADHRGRRIRRESFFQPIINNRWYRKGLVQIGNGEAKRINMSGDPSTSPGRLTRRFFRLLFVPSITFSSHFVVLHRTSYIVQRPRSPAYRSGCLPIS
ncbi:Uncharacterized protein HZ326_17392 [Fusarium oxysporum f. sp. albedinis]|nr:Uncharacterized protein HZ326_17392 [Fusarium oxysporum f. sp. albedinis]